MAGLPGALEAQARGSSCAHSLAAWDTFPGFRSSPPAVGPMRVRPPPADPRVCAPLCHGQGLMNKLQPVACSIGLLAPLIMSGRFLCEARQRRPLKPGSASRLRCSLKTNSPPLPACCISRLWWPCPSGSPCRLLEPLFSSALCFPTGDQGLGWSWVPERPRVLETQGHG